MKILLLSLLLVFVSFSQAITPVLLLDNQEILDKALSLGLETSKTIGFDTSMQSDFYTGGPVFVQDLVAINPNAYGQLYSEVFQTEEIKMSVKLSKLPREFWSTALSGQPVTRATDLAMNDLLAKYSGYYEVEVYHVESGCAAQVRFLAAKQSNWSAGNLCSETTMLSSLDVQQITGLTVEPKLVTFEHTLTSWGMMWLQGSVAVQPYTGEIYVVTNRYGDVINPLTTDIALEFTQSYTIGRDGPVINRDFVLPVQLRPLSYFQAGN